MSVAATVTKRTAPTKTKTAFTLIVSYFLAILAGVIGVAMKLAYHLNPVAAYREAKVGYRRAKAQKLGIYTDIALQDENAIRARFAQEDRVMTIIMIGVLVIIGLFVIATVYVQMPSTGSDQADNSIDNFTTDIFGHFELFALVALIIIIALVVFYVRSMSD